MQVHNSVNDHLVKRLSGKGRMSRRHIASTNGDHAVGQHAIHGSKSNYLPSPHHYETGVHAETKEEMSIKKMVAHTQQVLNLPDPEPIPWDPMKYRLGYVVVEVLTQLKGRLWDSISRSLVESERPTVVRVLNYGVEPSLDSVWWRVTVYLDEGGLISKCEQERKVPLPNHVPDGRTMRFMMGTEP
jgi:hypothetical protein